MTGKSRPDLEAGYNNRAACPDHPAVMARWKAEAEVTRAAEPPTVLRYGPGPRETIDLFEAGPGAPVVAFLHGGYWQALDPSWFSWIAPPLLARGISVAIPAYDLCPQVSLATIIEQMRTAIALLTERAATPPVLVGHSAGGHLAACLLSEGLAGTAVSISGVFDLRPLVHTSINTALRLDPAEAARLSPLGWTVPEGAVLDCLVGGGETTEFIRQSRMMAEAWGAAGADTRFEALTDLDHFTVLDPLAAADSALVRRIAELALSA